MKPLLVLKTYAWLINTIRTCGPISYKELLENWREDRLSEGNSMVRQTFINYKRDLEEFFNISIKCDNKYRYYIENSSVLQQQSVQNWMVSTMDVNMSFADNREIYDRIVMEVIPSAGYFLNDIIDAMKSNAVIEIQYQRYDTAVTRNHRVEPYFIKLYHQRWYLLGRKDDGSMLTFALDRIKAMTITDETFAYDKRIKANDYFCDCFGVMKDETKPAERIVLRAYGTEANYLRDLKLHHSQKEIASCDDYSDFELYLRPSMDFRGKLMERSDRLEVIEPQHLAQEIEQMHLNSVNLYKNRVDISKV